MTAEGLSWTTSIYSPLTVWITLWILRLASCSVNFGESSSCLGILSNLFARQTVRTAWFGGETLPKHTDSTVGQEASGEVTASTNNKAARAIGASQGFEHLIQRLKANKGMSSPYFTSVISFFDRKAFKACCKNLFVWCINTGIARPSFHHP